MALGRECALRGPLESALSPPSRQVGEVRVALGPRELRLPGGRVAHDFLLAGPDGARSEVERFETIRPNAILSIPAGDRHGGNEAAAAGTDLLIELDDRLAVGPGRAKLERYDHFLAGWSLHTRRYGKRQEASPIVVFLCRDRGRAREMARHADPLLCSARAYAGEYPHDWEYPGREAIVFACERDAHDHVLLGYGVAALPPQVRVAAAGGDPAAGEAEPTLRPIAPGTSVEDT
jgi:hypothetical protein